MKLSFVLNDCNDLEKAGNIVTSYLAALRMNGQILGKEYPILYKNNMILSYVFIPEYNSLDSKYSNKYVLKGSSKNSQFMICHPKGENSLIREVLKTFLL
jgi:predicted  nucleic acid-binding Zn ribbon protein